MSDSEMSVDEQPKKSRSRNVVLESDSDGPEVIDNNSYVVERVVSRRKNCGKTEYLIKWKNYPSSDNTWEPEENCSDCQELINEFLKRNEKRKRRSTSTTSSAARNRSRSASKHPKREQSEHQESKKTEEKASAEERMDEGDDNTKPLSAEAPAQAPSPAPAPAEAPQAEEGHQLSTEPIYGVSQGKRVEKIIGVSRTSEKEIMAVVNYSDYTFEAVPTKVLQLFFPQLLIRFYEDKLSFGKLGNKL
ncbi:hypothetical protein QR680_000932 [Steinernema hermaphroditum]|uniref:Chromo domain-containing protein n=1 Tax=Steinernema hermaphroditum TaxID=289476 RepID=A0AA39GX49_9BILA|nr:hypothetical protein QR680_000932 [Steinernema hermaphroditum]